MFSLAELEAAADLVHAHMPPTPQYAWPLLARRTGVEVWVKHENHTPIGAFKVRGGLVYMHELKRSGERAAGVVTATRGNHGQSVARAAAAVGLASTVVVPRGNSVEKNAAMRAFGAELVEHGRDFDEARDEAVRLARELGLHYVPSFHPALVKGVASYGLELLRGVAGLDAVYVPIGMGSGICGMIAVRDALGLDTEIIGVVAEKAPCVALSFEAGRPVPTNSAQTFADGLACRVPHPDALEAMRRGAARIVRVGEDAIAETMRFYYEDTHNLVEGAGAAALAALLQERDRQQGRRVGLVVSGGNIDRSSFAAVLAGRTPPA
jgi:threonine dehydratase